MRSLTIFIFLVILSSHSFSESPEWARQDLYTDGSKSALDGDCFTAIGQLFAFKEFNILLLEEHKDTTKAIDSAILKCRKNILTQRKVEYMFLPTEKDCGCENASGSGSLLGINKVPKVKYLIVRKKGNPNGMELPEFDVIFDLETSRSNISYPLVPSYYDEDEGEFKPYGSNIYNFKEDATSASEVEFSSDDVMFDYHKSLSEWLECENIDRKVW